MNYVWKIVKLSTSDQVNADGDTLTDAVVRVKWKKIAVDENGIGLATYLGYNEFDASNTTSADFIPFADLTEEQVLSWVKASHSSDFTISVDSIIAKKIAKADTTERFVPW